MVVLIAAVLGYVWMGEGGAIAVALAGLWGHYGAVRPWRFGHAVMLVVVAAVMLVPGLLWAAGLFHPQFAEALYGAIPHVFDRLLDYTSADEVALRRFIQRGEMEFYPAVRLGVALCWLCALPAAAAIVLWFDGLPAGWTVDKPAKDADKALIVIVLGVCVMTVLAMISGPRSMAPVFGAVLNPAMAAMWVLGVAALRAWFNWWLAARRREVRP